jgi:hypothetical protein
MRIITSDGIGMRALLGVAEKLHALTEEYNVALGVVMDEGKNKAIAVAYHDDRGFAVTVEANPKIVELDDGR